MAFKPKCDTVVNNKSTLGISSSIVSSPLIKSTFFFFVNFSYGLQSFYGCTFNFNLIFNKSIIDECNFTSF